MRRCERAKGAKEKAPRGVRGFGVIATNDRPHDYVRMRLRSSERGTTSLMRIVDDVFSCFIGIITWVAMVRARRVWFRV